MLHTHINVYLKNAVVRLATAHPILCYIWALLQHVYTLSSVYNVYCGQPQFFLEPGQLSDFYLASMTQWLSRYAWKNAHVYMYMYNVYVDLHTSMYTHVHVHVAGEHHYIQVEGFHIHLSIFNMLAWPDEGRVESSPIRWRSWAGPVGLTCVCKISLSSLSVLACVFASFFKVSISRVNCWFSTSLWRTCVS